MHHAATSRRRTHNSHTSAALRLLCACVVLSALGCGSDAKKDPDSGTAGTSAGNGGEGGSGATSGDGGSGGSGGDAGSAGSGATSGDGGTGGSGGSGPCNAPSDCNDNINCTADGCVDGRCTNVIDATLCSAGQVCDLREGGCTASTACGGNPDCMDSDACTRNERCDTSAAACLWDLLDSDSDGHAPITCGGDDFDDADPASYPGALDVCDGKDNDRDGVVDTGTPCGGFCLGEADRMFVEEPLVENAVRQCAVFEETQLQCLLQGGREVAPDCVTCLEMWLDCARICQCSASTQSDCRACECARGCVTKIEMCTGTRLPFECQ